MEEAIQAIIEEAKGAVTEVSTSQSLYELKTQFLGKKGKMQQLMPLVAKASKEERPKLGQVINLAKKELEQLFSDRQDAIERIELEEKLAREKIDTTLPGRSMSLGSKHPISAMIEEVSDIFTSMGFHVEAGQEVESSFFNYDSLNYREDHPAKDMQDTFYISEDIQLRSHTTSFQSRIMASTKPPIRAISLGKCYRNETISMRSHAMFHQVDGLYIDKGVTFADLVSTLETFYSRLFRQEVNIRLRSSYFPFVEPGAEMDISCTICQQKGCSLCKQTGWLEVIGCGMVHPNVLEMGGIDPNIYSGFAFGGGIERVVMLRNGIKDIRAFTQNDKRMLQQFASL